MKGISVRMLKERDLEEVIEMISASKRASYKGIYPDAVIEEKVNYHNKELFEERMKVGIFFVAVNSEEKIIGIAGIIGMDFKTFFVHPDFQGQGVGRKLHDEVVAFARGEGLTELKVESTDVAVPIYEHFGFRRVGEKSRERAGFVYQNVLMEKSI